MLIKNQIYEAEITDYTAEGQGVAHIEGCAVFIPNAVAGGEGARPGGEGAEDVGGGENCGDSGKVPPPGQPGV